MIRNMNLNPGGFIGAFVGAVVSAVVIVVTRDNSPGWPRLHLTGIVVFTVLGNTLWDQLRKPRADRLDDEFCPAARRTGEEPDMRIKKPDRRRDDL